MKTSDIKQHFIKELQLGNMTVDRTGAKTIELLGASFEADAPTIFGTVNQDYVNTEIDWYMQRSLNINTMRCDTPPAAWVQTANSAGEINSNYGYLIYSDNNYSQYKNCLHELLSNPNSRRATMIYTRPKIWYEWNERNKNDFICTNTVSYYIRSHAVHAVVQMRSNDVVFGYKNDYAWQMYVLKQLTKDINNRQKTNYGVGTIHWQVQNLHVYERHFHLVS